MPSGQKDIFKSDISLYFNAHAATTCTGRVRHNAYRRDDGYIQDHTASVSGIRRVVLNLLPWRTLTQICKTSRFSLSHEIKNHSITHRIHYYGNTGAQNELCITEVLKEQNH